MRWSPSLEGLRLGVVSEEVFPVRYVLICKNRLGMDREERLIDFEAPEHSKSCRFCFLYDEISTLLRGQISQRSSGVFNLRGFVLTAKPVGIGSGRIPMIPGTVLMRSLCSLTLGWSFVEISLGTRSGSDDRLGWTLQGSIWGAALIRALVSPMISRDI